MPKHLLYTLTVLMISGCISVTHQDFYVKEKLSTGKTIKVIHPNTENLVQGIIEQALIKEGWSIVAHHTVSGQVPIGQSTTITTRDTTFVIPVLNHRVIKLFDEKPSDYILKYQYSGNSYRLWRFNASILNAQTGEIINTYTFRKSGWSGHRSDKIIGQMIEILELNM